MWDKHAVQYIEEVVGTLPITCKFKFFFDEFEWPFSRVYGPNADSKRHFWWEELSGFPVGRKFLGVSRVHFANERFGATQITFSIREFFDFISKQGLMHILLAGGSFTWSNNQDLFSIQD